MKYFILVTFLFLSANAKRRVRIANGNNAKIEDNPHQVALLNKQGELVCGGSIISNLYVLTAAHCVNEGHYKPTHIRAGSEFYWKNGSLHQVISNSTKTNWRNGDDIAILEVKEHFVFDNTRKPIKLPKKDDTFPAGTIAKTSGWGYITPDDIFFTLPEEPDQLQSVELSIVDRVSCNNVYKDTSIGNVIDSMICAGGNKKGSCKYDSGGPLVVDDLLVGIVSKGIGCASEGYPDIYTNVAFFRDWIKKKTGV